MCLNNTPCHCAGVYAIVHVETGRCYIGSAVDLAIRWQRHKTGLRGGYHHNIHLQRAWNKYGESSFAFQVLEYIHDPTLVIGVEQRWIDFLIPHFNICKKAGNTAGLMPSDAARAALALGPQSRKGKPVSAETRARISAAHTGRVSPQQGKPLTEDQKAKISAAKKGKPWSEARRAAQERRKSCE